MAENLTDTNVGNTEYICKADAIDAVNHALDRETILFSFVRKVAISALKKIAPADVVPVRHGKWKKIGAWGRVYRCDQCGNFLDFDGVNAGRGDANYCPNCGARMDGKKEG